MLARIEEAYLTVLRMAVVVVAGLALVLATAAFVGGAIYFARGITKSATASPEGGGLAEFVREQKLVLGFGMDAEATEPTPAGDKTREISDGVDRAAALFAEYATKQGKATVGKSEAQRSFALQFDDLSREVGSGHKSEYDNSLVRLALQLKNSRGKPLTDEQIAALIQWHHRSFLESENATRRAAAADAASAWQWVVRAGQAFLMFTVIAFYFLLVRVERHLKLVNVVHRDGGGHAPKLDA